MHMGTTPIAIHFVYMKNRAGTRTVLAWALSFKALNLYLSFNIPVLHPPAECILSYRLRS